MWVGPQIKVVDERGRTITVFGRLSADEATQVINKDGQLVDVPAMEEHWMTMPKPRSRASQQHVDAELAANSIWVARRGTGHRHPVRFDQAETPNPVRVELPGLTLRWEKVTAILDRLSANGINQITLNQLRKLT